MDSASSYLVGRKRHQCQLKASKENAVLHQWKKKKCCRLPLNSGRAKAYIPRSLVYLWYHVFYIRGRLLKANSTCQGKGWEFTSVGVWDEGLTRDKPGRRCCTLHSRRAAEELQCRDSIKLHHKSNDHQSLNTTIISSNFIKTIYASQAPNGFNMFCIIILPFPLS